MEIIAYEATSRRFQFLTKAYKGTGGRLCTASCGHLVESKGLNKWCEAVLNEGHLVFKCPKCCKVWLWQEVCALACLTQEERSSCEEIISRITTQADESFKKCPECGLYVQRVDLEKLSAECLPCSETKKKVFVFCFDCLREWRNPDVQSNSCGNGACTFTALLQGCPTINVQNTVVHGCPKVRACPNCEVLTQHCLEGCSNIDCPNCNYTFCFRCLGLDENHTGGLQGCSIAERQKVSGNKVYEKREQLDDEDYLLVLQTQLEMENRWAQLQMHRVTRADRPQQPSHQPGEI
uniref:RBR-type E3 ubiquitin transferase n=1 Tax=Callorhinchus milii TaxID=7868 RepID=A0A4W3GCC3_CALMI|eukprot:gi/632988473/ref/XP_007883132.1/ PREDICTED: probable E3 ubiquitin-protein ligase RNF217 [Callorhinchus milii]